MSFSCSVIIKQTNFEVTENEHALLLDIFAYLLFVHHLLCIINATVFMVNIFYRTTEVDVPTLTFQTHLSCRSHQSQLSYTQNVA